jgi:hypothetical protein
MLFIDTEGHLEEKKSKCIPGYVYGAYHVNKNKIFEGSTLYQNIKIICGKLIVLMWTELHLSG